jgi:hypothetical protein
VNYYKKFAGILTACVLIFTSYLFTVESIESTVDLIRFWFGFMSGFNGMLGAYLLATTLLD